MRGKSNANFFNKFKPKKVYQAHFKISGRVQGVAYRFYAREKAAGLNLKGWIQNMDDGTVEATLQGTQGSLSAFRTWAYEGAPASKVDSVEMVMQTPDEPFYLSLKIS